MASEINIYSFFQISGKEFQISEKVICDIRNNGFFWISKKRILDIQNNYFRYPKTLFRISKINVFFLDIRNSYSGYLKFFLDIQNKILVLRYFGYPE